MNLKCFYSFFLPSCFLSLLPPFLATFNIFFHSHYLCFLDISSFLPSWLVYYILLPCFLSHHSFLPSFLPSVCPVSFIISSFHYVPLSQISTSFLLPSVLICFIVLTFLWRLYHFLPSCFLCLSSFFPWLNPQIFLPHFLLSSFPLLFFPSVVLLILPCFVFLLSVLTVFTCLAFLSILRIPSFWSSSFAFFLISFFLASCVLSSFLPSFSQSLYFLLTLSVWTSCHHISHLVLFIFSSSLHFVAVCFITSAAGLFCFWFHESENKGNMRQAASCPSTDSPQINSSELDTLH